MSKEVSYRPLPEDNLFPVSYFGAYGEFDSKGEGKPLERCSGAYAVHRAFRGVEGPGMRLVKKVTWAKGFVFWGFVETLRDNWGEELIRGRKTQIRMQS